VGLLSSPILCSAFVVAIVPDVSGMPMSSIYVISSTPVSSILLLCTFVSSGSFLLSIILPSMSVNTLPSHFYMLPLVGVLLL